jgi:hypothetical protein
MLVLSQFVLRLSFGLALAMAVTSPRKVTSGFFRNHSYVLLGLNVLGALAACADQSQLHPWPPIVAAVLAYLCSAAWLYQIPKLGVLLLWSVAAVSLVGALLDLPTDARTRLEPGGDMLGPVLWRLDPLASGQLLGTTIAAMFLGHWYLNTPTMEIGPLQRLLRLMAEAIVVRGAVCGAGLAALSFHGTALSTAQWLMIGLRWAAGIIGVAVLAWMAWQTLKIPNTQSATGILYVAVVTVFIGELTSLLLSGGTAFPV